MDETSFFVWALAQLTPTDRLALPLDADVVCPQGLVTSPDTLSLTGLGPGLTSINLGNAGFRFAGRELILRDLSLEMSVSAQAAALTIVLGDGIAATEPLRIVLERVRITAVDSGVIIVVPPSGVDLFMEDVTIEVGEGIGLAVVSAAAGAGLSRCCLRSCHIKGWPPVLLNSPGARLRDCQFETSEPPGGADIRPPTINFYGNAGDARVVRCRFAGDAQAGVTLSVPNAEALAAVGLADVQIVQCTSNPSVSALLSLASGGRPEPVVHGLWVDACSRFTDIDTVGWLVDEAAAQGAAPSVARLAACFNRDSFGRYFSHGGAGFDVEGHHAAMSSSREPDTRRRGGNLLRDTGFKGPDWDSSPTIDLTYVGEDPVLGRIDALGAQFEGTLELRQTVLKADVEGQPLVFSVFARQQVQPVKGDVPPLGPVEIKVWVESADGVVGGSALRFRVRDWWHRFSAVVAYAPPGELTVCVDVVSVLGNGVILWAPQLEVGAAATEYQPRESGADGLNTPWPRQVQAMMLGPMTMGYAESKDTVPAGAEAGDRFLNLAPSAPSVPSVPGAEDGWILVQKSNSVPTPHAYNPLGAGTVAECGTVSSQPAVLALDGAPPTDAPFAAFMRFQLSLIDGLQLAHKTSVASELRR